jgi:hypothetical protein
MSDVSKDAILERLNLTADQGKALIEAAIKSPMEALGLVQTFGIDQDALQQLITEFMGNPGVFIELAESLGMPKETIDEFKSKFSL